MAVTVKRITLWRFARTSGAHGARIVWSGESEERTHDVRQRDDSKGEAG